MTVGDIITEVVLFLFSLTTKEGDILKNEKTKEETDESRNPETIKTKTAAKGDDSVGGSDPASTQTYFKQIKAF